MKLGILGGTFNPVHNGHLAIAEAVYNSLQLDKIYMVPAYNPPHKENEKIIDFEERVRLLELATVTYPYLEVSRLDHTPGSVSYTKHLIERLKEKYPDASFYFIIGADIIPQLSSWYDYKWLLDNVTFVALPRGDFEIVDYWNLDYIEKIQSIDMDPVNISSRMIRQKLARDEDISALVPSVVAEYIKQNNLYSQ
jgi:nicotinate-nucleotide adenylyltransferase